MLPLITLSTDFGIRDPYVAAMKGVILSQCPDARILDLSHDIEPRDVVEGALYLSGAARFYPEGTIHVAVVDPGVGTGRHPIVARLGAHTYVCPNNGLLTFLMETDELHEARIIENDEFMLDEVSTTFHGRDIFAPTAGRLAAGAPLEDVGSKLDTLFRLDMPQATQTDARNIYGEVVHIDHFGNVITNVPKDMLKDIKSPTVRIGPHIIDGISRTYGEADPKTLLALIGSTGRLELSINRGRAAERLNAHRGTVVNVREEAK